MLDLEKAEEWQIKLPTSVGSSKKQESSRKTSTSALLATPKPLTVWITSVENFSRDGNTRPPYLPPDSPCGSAGKESACNAGDLGLISGLARSPGVGKCYPLQISGLENSMDCIVHEDAKSWTWLSNFHIRVHITCLLRNLYAGQEATVRIGHGIIRMVQNCERSTSRLYIVTLLI